MGVMDGIKSILGMGQAPEVIVTDDTAARQRIAELWSKDAGARKPLEQQWQLNIAMFTGNQWCGWTGQTVLPLSAPSWRVQAVDNKLFVRTRSKMTGLLTDSTPQFIPETAEHIDIRRSRYKERVLSHVNREIHIEQIKARAALWTSVCGECYTEAYWDETAGDTYADDAGAFSEGEVGLKVRGPFEVWPGVGASVGNNGGRLWTADTVPVELARLRWNTNEITPDAGDLTDTQLRANLDAFFQNGIPGSRGIDAATVKNLEESVVVKVLREYRTRALPQGRISTIINGKTVDERPMFWDGMTHIINFPSFHSYHGDPIEMRLSIQPQKSINRLESNWEEYTKLMAKGKILAPKSANIKSSQFDSENGEVITYDSVGPKPEQWQLQSMPSDTAQLIQLRTQTIDDIYSDHMASQGKAPASASGAAINYLIESDQEQHTLTRDLWNAGWERTYEKVMDVVAGKAGEGTGYTEDRMITILGENRRADVQKVDLELLGGKNRVSLVIGGALPTNKTLRAEVVRRWYVDGALGDPTQKETRRKFIKMTDAGVLDDVFDDEALDEIRAEKENERLALGIPVAPRPEDDHAIHIWSLKHYMKTDEFLLLPIPVQELFYDHQAVHESAMSNPAAALALLAAKGGKPPGPPQPSQPKPPAGPDNSPAMKGPGELLKSVTQGGEAPPAIGAPGSTSIAQ